MEAEINVEFEEAAVRQSLESGENLSSLFGKIKTWLGSLKPVCFSGDAETVNGHRVKTDVPENAVFTDTLNSDVLSGTGDIATLKELQSEVPFSEIFIYGKNLFDGELAIGMVGATSGVIDSSTDPVKKYISTKNLAAVEAITTYTASNAENKKIDAVVYYDEHGNVIGNTYTTTAGFDTFTTPYNCKFVRWRYLYDDVQADTGVLSNVQLEKGNAATSYEAPLIGTAVDMRVCGKNLIPQTYKSASVNGVDFTVNADGSVSASGTATADIYFTLDARDYMLYKKGAVMSLSGCPKGGGVNTFNLYYSLRNINNVSVGGHGDNGEGVTFTMSTRPDVTAIGVTIKVCKNVSINDTFYPQLEIGSGITAYEPYCGKEYCFVINTIPYTVRENILQRNGTNNLLVSNGRISAVGVRSDKAVGNIWDSINKAYADISSDAAGIVALNDIQGGVPFSKLQINNRNLLGQPSAACISGNSVTGFNVISSEYSRNFICKLRPNTTYTLKRYDKGNRFRLVFFNEEPTDTVDKTAMQQSASSPTCTFTTGSDHLWLAYTSHTGDKDTDVVEPVAQLEYGSAATDYIAPIIGQEVTLRACGKNLIPYPYRSKDGALNGVTFTVSDDGSITANGTATANTNFYICFDRQLNFPNGKYTMSGCPVGGSLYTYRLEAYSYDDDNKLVFSKKDIGDSAVIDLSSNLHFGVRIGIYQGVTCENLVFRPQLELGASATAYDLYHGSEVKVMPDTVPYIVPNDIRQQDGVNNIMVSAGTVQVTGARRSAALKKVWDKLDEIAAMSDLTEVNGDNE